MAASSLSMLFPQSFGRKQGEEAVSSPWTHPHCWGVTQGLGPSLQLWKGGGETHSPAGFPAALPKSAWGEHELLRRASAGSGFVAVGSSAQGFWLEKGLSWTPLYRQQLSQLEEPGLPRVL